ncbi:MAG: DsrE family protein [Myxococcales bacterium]|nr:DsrE family protein [Myxococcales bacterium]
MHDDEPDYDLQIVIVSGAKDVQRVVFGLASALAAAASGVRVVVVFSMHGAHWASAYTGDGLCVPEFPSIAELITELHEHGVTIEGCATCIDNYCPSPVADGERSLRGGIRRVGLGLVAIRMASIKTVLC